MGLAMPTVMTLENQKEQFSRAYALAVASVAGCGHYTPEPDDESVDIGFSSRIEGSVLRKPKVEVQLKATARDLVKDTHIAFPLSIKNYDDLRLPTHVPRILVVVVVPDKPANWISQTEFKTHVYRCAYWATLLGQPQVNGQDTRTVHVSRSQVFTPEALKEMLARIANGGVP